MRFRWRRAPLLAGIALFILLPPQSRGGEDAATLYLEMCSLCHSLGGGDLAGPDLLPSSSWPRAELRDAVARMEENTDGLTPEQIEALVDLLQNPNAREMIAAAEAGEVPAPVSPLAEGSRENGRALFFGKRPLANGGSPCFACHAAEGGGGNLARDLTGVHGRLNPEALLTVTERPPFPLMKAAYVGRPVTPEEAVDIAAYLAEPPITVAAMPRTSLAYQAIAAALVLLALAAIAAGARTRRAGVRARLVRSSRRR